LTASSDKETAPVSVVVPCYRCAGTIERAIRSVGMQSRRPAELILVDDASGDGTGAVLEELRARHGPDWIRIITLERNQGPATARNAGWDAATQRYVAFLDADDAWDARKLEIQCAWMEAHPGFAVTGHASRQLLPDAERPADPGEGEAKTVSKSALFLSNPFITPSVMLRREITQRFEAGKRHMEDYLLWLEVALSGRKIARLPQVLAYTFKAPFGESGLSAQAWEMEKGELAAFTDLLRRGYLGFGFWLLLSGFSFIKFLRRLVILAAGYSPGGNASHPSYLFPAAYMVLTQAMTALLVGAGLLGDSEVAADIGIVQAATLATFFAFSGNARNLILTTQGRVSVGGILVARMALLLPLGAMALLLSILVARIAGGLALLLVARRIGEWIGEVELSDSELRGDKSAAKKSLALQSVLLLMALLAMAFAPTFVLWAFVAWALVPIFPALRFAVPELRKGGVSLRASIAILLPHFGSTAVMGVSLYAYRALLVLVAGKAVAGDLFVAFAIGSFLGTIFANVLGASFSLHEERGGRPYLPGVLWAVMLLYLVAGTAILAATHFAPSLLEASHRTIFFWQAMGWSLLGGVAMLVAQRGRVRLLAAGRGEDVFGADVLIHVLLIAAVPVLYATGSDGRLTMLYALNAALALVFYATSERGFAARLGPRAEMLSTVVLTFCIFFPLFVLLSGAVYNPAIPMVDSGGVLRNLPLPVSLFACYGGFLVLGRYRLATSGLWTILGLLVMMLLSVLILSGSEAVERAKMLLLLQVLLPTFGLVFGAVVASHGDRQFRIAAAIFTAVALIVPAQLAASWFAGAYTLTHSLFAFAVYQHFEFVPVILVCGFLAALPTVWARSGLAGKAAIAALFALLAVYAAAALSVSGMLAVAAGAIGFAVLRVLARRELAAIAVCALVLGSLVGYNVTMRNTNEFRLKFSFLFPPDEDWVVVSGYSKGVRNSFGTWMIESETPGGIMMRVAPDEHARRASLTIEGQLERGEIVVNLEDPLNHTMAPKLDITQPGPFKVELEMDRNRDKGDVILSQGMTATEGAIRRLRWTRLQDTGDVPRPATVVADPAPAPPTTVRNVAERVSDWKLFGSGILDSPRAFFFGHEKMMPREVRTSAHNFYIDFIYNFGVLAVLPLIALILYTLAQLWHLRPRLFASESLLTHAAVVLFLVLLESNVKVTLRQPYPGIAIYFLWGLLLARLREPAVAAATARVD
jgi:glycosyltransferase involved in cell wall biosynthesis